MRRRTVLALLMTVLAGAAGAAINPAEFQHDASDTLRIRESARVVQDIPSDGARLRRVTLVGEVIEQAKARGPMVGRTVVIDFTVNLTQREQARKEHARRNGNRPGPQFMHQPDPPALDADGAYWAHLVPAVGPPGRADQRAGAAGGTVSNEYAGEIYVPAAGQYSFDPPPR